MSHTGSCRCGAVRFSTSAEPHHVSYYHCSDCRRASGAPVSAFVGFMAGEVEFSGTPAQVFANGLVTRSFCGVCGSPLTYADARLAGHLYFVVGAMDRPEDFPPTCHAYVDRQLPYLHMTDGLPRHPATTVPRPDGSAS